MTFKDAMKKIREMQIKIAELERAIEEKLPSDPFKREKGQYYYRVEAQGIIRPCVDNSFSDSDYAVANYCTDIKLMRKRAAEETLSRLIWREAEIANAGREDEGRYRYVIDYNVNLKTVIYCQVPWHLESPGIAGFIHVDDVRACVKDVVIPFVKSCPELGWELEEQGEE